MLNLLFLIQSHSICITFAPQNVIYYCMVRGGVIGFILILIGFFTYGQMSEPWETYFGTSSIKDSKFGIYHELQVRDHILIGGQYKFNPNMVGTVGLGTYHSEISGTYDHPYKENQIYQEMLISHKIDFLRFRHRLRTEERFLENQSMQGRFRYCMFVDIPVINVNHEHNEFYIALYDELFMPINSHTFFPLDRNRVYEGIGCKLNSHISFQVGYMQQHIFHHANSHQILLSAHHKISWGS